MKNNVVKRLIMLRRMRYQRRLQLSDDKPGRPSLCSSGDEAGLLPTRISL